MHGKPVGFPTFGRLRRGKGAPDPGCRLLALGNLLKNRAFGRFAGSRQPCRGFGNSPKEQISQRRI